VQWEAFLRRYRVNEETGVPTTLAEVIRLIAAFLGPVLEAVSEGRRFDKRWPPGGPWTSLAQM
jgi:hypothetical protein